MSTITICYLKKTTDLAHANIIESNLNQSAEFFHLSEL